MNAFNMEVNYTIKYHFKFHVLVMVALNKESLFKRNVCAFGPTTMRSTMCYCGSIQLEGALAFSECLFIGADLHPKAIDRCLANKEYCAQPLLQSGSEVEFLYCDAGELPLRESSIDAIITDLPFGKKIGSIGDNRILYPRLLVEWERVVKPDGRMVVMTHDKRSWGKLVSV
ncbi:unnamed protein product, partial [Strongylus vulgaris]